MKSSTRLRSLGLLYLAVILTSIAATCSTPKPPVVTYPDRPFTVHTCAGANAVVELNAPQFPPLTVEPVLEPGNGVMTLTDANGDAHFPVVPGDLPTGFNLHMAQMGYPVHNEVLLLTDHVAHDLHVPGCGTPLTDFPRQVLLQEWKPLFTPLSRLVQRGDYFEQATGDRISLIESSDFNLLNRWQHGEDITPLLEQRRVAGFNTLRVWTLYDAGTGAGDFRDIDYSRVGAFLDFVASKGFYIDLTAYAGNLTYRADHYDRLCAAIQGKTNVLLSPVNELEASASNWVDISGIDKCPGVLTSSGSNGSEAWPPTQVHYTPDWLEFHTNDHDQWWRTSGHNAWEVAEGAYPVHLPTITNEQTRYDKMDFSHPDRQAMLNRLKGGAEGCALLNAGCAFHSNEGKQSLLFPPDVLEAANAHVSGFHVFPLICQDGPYTHNTAVEMLEMLLRAYEHPGNPVECIARIPF